MRRVTAILSGVAVVLMAAGVVAQAKPNFAGEWKWAMGSCARPGRARGRPDHHAERHGDDSCLRDGGPAPAPVKLTYKLDGSESKNMMAGRGGGAPTEQVSKAMWSGNNTRRDHHDGCR